MSLLWLLPAVCGAAGTAPESRATSPVLEIRLADPELAAAAAEPATRARAVAMLRAAGLEAPGRVDLSRWPTAAGSRKAPRIRVELKKKSSLFGVRRFDLRPPEAMHFRDAVLVFEHLRREGLLAPRIRLVRVRLGDADLGLMALEEAYSKELLESQRRREGVLLRLEPDVLPLARVDAYQSKRVGESEQLSREMATAEGLLQAFLRDEVAASAVFDIDATARFVAIALLWDAATLLQPANLRFYFNPVTQRLEPVACSSGLMTPSGPAAGAVTAPDWASQLFEDAALRTATARELQRLAREGDAAPDWFEPEAARLRSVLAAAGVAAGGTAFVPWPQRAATLATFVPVAPEADDIDRVAPDPKVASLRTNPIPAASLEEALERHPFLRWDAEAEILRANRGDWQVAGSLVLPEGIGLEAGPGTTLRFGADALLVASGPLRFRGSAEAPVTLRGLAVPGRTRAWQGIVVLRSGAPLDWQHVVVADTTGIEHRGWRLTGGFTLRDSEARIVDSRFEGNRAEDAVNLIRSRFEFRGVSIRDTASDAFDCDFCEGSVIGGRVEQAGGDGIDVSGSVVGVDGTVIEDVADKAISVGERSRLDARNVSIRRVGTAIVGKDGSSVTFEDSKVSDVEHVAIMAYTKKREYGPGSVIARNIEMVRVGRAASAQHGSQVFIDGVSTAPGEVDVGDLYKQGYMKK